MLKPVDFEVGKHYKDMDIEKVKPDTTIFKKDEYGDYYLSRDLGERWTLINDVIESFEDTFTPFVDSIDDWDKVNDELERMAGNGFLINIIDNEWRDERLIYFKNGNDYVSIIKEDGYNEEIRVSHHNRVDFGFCIRLADNRATLKLYKGGFREMKGEV